MNKRELWVTAGQAAGLGVEGEAGLRCGGGGGGARGFVRGRAGRAAGALGSVSLPLEIKSWARPDLGCVSRGGRGRASEGERGL